MSVKPATHRGKPVWRVQVIRDGGAFNRRRFLDRRRFTKQHALDAEAELIAEYEAQVRAAAPSPPSTLVGALTPADPGRPPAVPTFAAFAATYLALQDPGRSDHRNKLRNIRMHLVPRLGHLRVDQISPMIIDALRVDLRVAAPAEPLVSGALIPGRPAPAATPASAALPPPRAHSASPDAPASTSPRSAPARSPKTVNNILATLRAILHLAHDYELIHRLPRIRMDRTPRPDPVYLDDDEMARFLAAAPDPWRLFFLTALRTGLRAGELMALRWDDLHLDAPAPALRVQRSIRRDPDGTLTPKLPKSGRPRTVPLTDDLAQQLSAARPPRPVPGALIFPGPVQGYLGHHRIWTATVTTARSAGISKHVHPHLLRHTFASHCYRLGIPPQVVQLWLGHAHISTTERYAHLAAEQAQGWQQKLGQSLGVADGEGIAISGPNRKSPVLQGKISNNQ
ncbi:MAG TPA: site-specific integrase [Nannocystaceae bacterium]|nr:site-specific integrase [Nannocystaceae bacterium]